VTDDDDDDDDNDNDEVRLGLQRFNTVLL